MGRYNLTLTCTLGWNVDLVYFGLDRSGTVLHIYTEVDRGGQSPPVQTSYFVDVLSSHDHFSL